MAKSTGSRSSSKGSNRGGSKGGSRGRAGWPSKTGNPSGGDRNNAPAKGKSKYLASRGCPTIDVHRGNISINISVYLVDAEYFEDLSASRLIPFGIVL